MDKIIRAQKVPLRCPHCGREGRERVRNLTVGRTFACAGCGRDVTVTPEQRSHAVRVGKRKAAKEA